MVARMMRISSSAQVLLELALTLAVCPSLMIVLRCTQTRTLPILILIELYMDEIYISDLTETYTRTK